MKSGYNLDDTRKVVLSGRRCYRRKCKEAEHNGSRLNRRMTCKTRRLNTLVKKKSDKLMWFKPTSRTSEDKPNEGYTSTSTRPNTGRSQVDLRKVVATFQVPRTKKISEEKNNQSLRGKKKTISQLLLQLQEQCCQTSWEGFNLQPQASVI